MRDSDLQFKASLIYYSVRENFFKLVLNHKTITKIIRLEIQEISNGYNKEAEVRRANLWETKRLFEFSQKAWREAPSTLARL